MDLRTVVQLPASSAKITHESPVMFMGSCFANEIGYRLSAGKLRVLTNPHGTLFNPFSVAGALDSFSEDYIYSEKDIFLHQNRYLSLNHHTAFSSYDRDVLMKRLNEAGRAASDFIRNASFLFITFGTSYVFTLKENGQIVANCHKLPSGLFTRRMASHTEIAERLWFTLDRLAGVNPTLKVWFTISPVRHLNEGAHSNQLSKAHLLLAVEELLTHPLVAGYFPAYEIFMDDLRDYRYYGPDMVHPSGIAIDYTWEKFSSVFIDPPAMRLWSEASKITRAVEHRLTGEKSEASAFASGMLEKIKELSLKAPSIDFSAEISYFKNIVQNI